MDKSLFPNSKEDDSQQKDAKVKSPATSQSAEPVDASAPDSQKKPDFSNASVGAYGPIAAKPIELNKKSWEDSAKDPKNTPWMNDPKSRLAIRMFSRGVLGAAFFTVGGTLARKSLRGYDPLVKFEDLEHKNFITLVARTIDKVMGVPIEAAVKAVTGDATIARRAVSFRPTYYPVSQANGPRLWGRSLGHEMVDVTFDFFCASVGDAWGRDIAGFFDPNVKKDWLDDKGHVNFPKAITNSLKAMTRYVTYNGGEDWAVALPYVYFMKGQRQILNHFSPGWKYDFDQQKNGGSFKMAGNPLKDGKTDYHHFSSVAGSYAQEGIMDLQSRFTVYNIGTLMYRELYDYVGNRMHGKKDHLYGDPQRDDNPKMGVLDKAGELAKWAARSVIKGTIIMTPAVPFFSVTRATQSKHRGLFIHPEHGILTRKDGNTGHLRPVEAGDVNHNPQLKDAPVYYSRYHRDLIGDVGAPYDRIGPMDPLTANPATRLDPTLPKNHGTTQPYFHPYAMGQTLGGKVLDTIGQRQHEAAQLLTPLANFADKHGGAWGDNVKKTLGFTASGGTRTSPNHYQSFKVFTHPFARASISYTPYMYAKAEFANLWDNGKTDMAAERLVDGAASLNWGEFKAGVGEVFNAVLHKQMADPEREVEAQRRIQSDTSAPEIFSDAQFYKQKKIEHEEHVKEEQTANQVKKLEAQRLKHSPQALADKQPPLSWQERIVSVKPVESPTAETGDTSKPQKSSSYTEQEAMRKALEELTPPTNAIN